MSAQPPPTYFFLTIEEGWLVVKYTSTQGHAITRHITSEEDLNNFLGLKALNASCKPEDLVVQCSSSLDFPEEEGASQEVIALCDAIRNPTEED